MSSFAQGLVAGQRMAQGWLDAYESSRKRKEEEELKARREGIMTAQPQTDVGYTPEQGEQLRLAAESGQYDIGYDEARGGYTVTPKADTSQVGIVAPQSRTQFLGQYAQGPMTPEQIRTTRERALVETIADPIERQRGLQALRQAELSDIQIARERDAVRIADANRTANAQLAELLSKGESIDIPRVYRLAQENGADPAALVKSAADFYGLDDKAAKAKTDKLIRDINEASVSPQKFNDLLSKSFDPNPADNIVPRLVQTKDGVQVMYGDQPLTKVFKNTQDMSGLAQMAATYRDQLSGNPLATAVQLASIEDKRSLAAYRDAAAKEAAARSGAAANALSNVQLGYTRGPNGQLVQVMSGVRFNKRTGDLETVQVPLDQNIIPTSALDPAKIAKQAEELIGTPIDPTNKKGPAHTAQSARQAVTDQIINQYLGTGGAGPDLSPQGLAQRIKDQAAPAAKQEQPAPAPRQPANVGIDTGRPSTNINPVTGLPRETPVQAPNLVAAASRGLSAAESNYKAYLQGKLDRKEKLTVDEQMRARRFGLQ